jgi:hypothetical protein
MRDAPTHAATPIRVVRGMRVALLSPVSPGTVAASRGLRSKPRGGERTEHASVSVLLTSLQSPPLAAASAPRLQTRMGKAAHPSTVPHTLPSRDRPTHGAGSLHTLCQ